MINNDQPTPLSEHPSRCLWDPKRDTWGEIELKLPAAHLFFQLYCIYLD